VEHPDRSDSPSKPFQTDTEILRFGKIVTAGMPARMVVIRILMRMLFPSARNTSRTTRGRLPTASGSAFVFLP